MNAPNDGLKIVKVEAFPTSFPVKEGVTLGIGRAVKRDCVIVKVTTESGLVGWGESHHGRCPGAIGQLINTTLRQLVTGMNATDVVGVWARIYSRQLASHGMGTAASLAMSGIDLALWDIRGKAVGWPLYKLLGGASKAIPAYAGGISLGFQPSRELVTEARALVEQGYRILKLRFGDNVKRDIERMFSPSVIRQAHRQIELAAASPGLREVALLDRMIDLIVDRGTVYDLIVVDTAPTGHTLQLLRMPDAVVTWRQLLPP